MRPSDIAVGLLAVAALIACDVGASAQSVDRETPGDCVLVPTASCVIDLAIDAADATADAHERAAALARIAEAQAEAGENEAASQNLSRALTAAAAIDEDAFSREAVLVGFPEDEAGLARAKVLSDIARVLATLGEAVRAEATFLRAVTVVQAIEGNRQRVQGLVAIATAQLAAGAPDAAQETFARAELVNDAEYLPGLHWIMRMHAETGDIDGALATAQRIGRENERGRALAAIADVQANAGDVTGALATADSVEHPYYRMVAMHYIGTARAQAGAIAGAWEAVETIGEIWHQDREGKAGSRDTVILQEDTIGAIVDAHIAAGEIEHALATTGDMMDALAYVEAHRAIAKAHLAAGNLDGAQGSADEVCGAHRRYADRCVELLSGLAIARASTGQTHRSKESLSMAQAVAEQIIYDDERARAFVALHAARTQMGDTEGAQRAFVAAMAAAEEFDYARERAERLTEMGAESTRIGDAVSAARAFAAALAAAAEIEDFDRQVRTFVRTGLTQEEVGDDLGARGAFSRATSAAGTLKSARRRAALLAEIAFALASGRLPTTVIPF